MRDLYERKRDLSEGPQHPELIDLVGRQAMDWTLKELWSFSRMNSQPLCLLRGHGTRMPTISS